MCRFILFVFAFCFTVNGVHGQFPIDSLMESNQTPTYEETISFYKDLSEQNKDIHLFKMGDTDYGLPIYLCVLNTAIVDSTALFSEARENTTMLINNAIHPGEPCGVNASMQLAFDFANLSPREKESFPLLGIIPAYNIGGMKNRGAYSRANQDGPKLHGFRGNAQNLDLNRDFVKMDSKNMFTFATIFQGLDPDVFIDTHTSNGADYQYTLTYITPVMEKLAPSIRAVFQEEMIPFLENRIYEEWNYEPFPYINLKGRTPAEGMVKFNASPRYSMGYADLFHSISFTTETHMLKPFEDRVKSTYAFLIETAKFTKNKSELIENARSEARLYDQKQVELHANFKLDTTPDSIQFKGYEWEYEKSEITEGDRLHYLTNQPQEITIPYYVNYNSTEALKIPSFFVVERQAFDVIERLAINGVQMRTLAKDTSIYVDAFKIKSYESLEKPYEGHYLHSNVEYDLKQDSVSFKKGDVIIPTDQDRRRYLVKMLSPSYMDSYFCWNFFDSYLQQKEHFSPYVFEEIAQRLLREDDNLSIRFEEKKEKNSSFAESRYSQLHFIYRNSPHYEHHAVLPVYRSVK